MSIIKSKVDKLRLKNKMLELKKEKINDKAVAKIKILDRQINKNKDLIRIENKYNGVNKDE